jgi:hypothetical protein
MSVGRWLAPVLVVAAVLSDGGTGMPVHAEDRAAQVAAFQDALDELVVRARPGGGWVFGTRPGARVHPHTYPLRFAERVAAPFGLADWDLVVLRSPGTPAAILSLLVGYRLTGREHYRASAIRAGDLLVATQMRSGGWFSEMPVHGDQAARWFDFTVQRTVIDDDVTPGAVRALLALWEMTGDARYRAAAERGLALLLGRQLPGGAWPLVARPRWKQRIWRDFEDCPTLNDGATTQTIVTLVAGFRALGRADLLLAARRGGDWIVRAQHAPPQAGWAQQYDEVGSPAPARRYERVALASWESRYALDALLALAADTGDLGYCAPLAPAVRWLEQSQLTPGCWARFYELDTNRPLYFNEQRQAVGSPAEAHQPYDWSGDFGIPALLARVTDGGGSDAPLARVPGDPGPCASASAPPFDPKTAGDPRHVIAYAARLAAAVEPPPASPCRVSSER